MAVENTDNEHFDLDSVMADGLRLKGTEQFNLSFAKESSQEEIPEPAIVVGDEGDTLIPASQGEETEDVEVKDTTEAEINPEKTEPHKADEPETNFRFKDQEAAEEAYRSLQGETTRSQQENADLKQQIADREAEKIAKAEALKRDKASREFATERNKEVLAKIDELDPEDPNYQEKVARYWADSNVDVFNAATKGIEKEPEPDEQSLETLPDVSPGPAIETPQIPEVSENDIYTYVQGRVDDAKLTDQEKVMFDGFAHRVPVTDEAGKPIPLKDQVDWAISQTKKSFADVKAQTTAQQNQPMGRAGTGQGPGGDGNSRSKNVSLDDALNHARELRRI